MELNILTEQIPAIETMLVYKGIFRRNELTIEFTDTSRPQYIGLIKSKLTLTKFNHFNIVSFKQFHEQTVYSKVR